MVSLFREGKNEVGLASGPRRDGSSWAVASAAEASGCRGGALPEPLVGAGPVALADLLPAGDFALEGSLIYAWERGEPVVVGAVTVAARVQLAGVRHPGCAVRNTVSGPPVQTEVAL